METPFPSDKAPQAPPGRDRRGWPWPLALTLEGGLFAPEDAPDSPLSSAERHKRAVARAERVLAGVAAYQAHPLPAARLDRPVVWSAGTTRLLDYGGAGPPVVVVPSLVNRATALDLPEHPSFMAAMAGAGLRAMLLDWGEPGPEELTFDLDAYARQRILPALAAAGESPALVGYCMGGTLAAGALSLEPQAAGRFAAMAAPWDFPKLPGVGALAASEGPRLTMAGAGGLFGALPGETLQTIFALRDPLLSARKFAEFAGLDPQSLAARRFVALEDWANDVVPMSLPAARNIYEDWLKNDALMRGAWRLGEHLVDPARFQGPSLVIAAKRDVVTPPDAVKPLAAALRGARLLEPDLGHLGLLVSARAPELFWAPFFAFLRGA